MENKRPLLSICIPTYNRAEKLRSCLDCVFDAIDGFHDINVIVSDNCSTDNTHEVLLAFSDHDSFHFYQNDQNLGYNGNMTLLIDKYSNGKYCWIIGDDDLIDKDAIILLYPLLVKGDYCFLSIAHRCLSESSYNSYTVPQDRELIFFKDSYFKCIDANSSDSNVLGTFMSSHIFLLETVRHFDKSVFPRNTWDDFRVTFPNSYMMTSCFHDNDNCCCVTTPLITALSYSKDWDDKLALIQYTLLPQYYHYCLELCNENTGVLKNNKKIVDRGRLFATYYRLKSSHKIQDKFKLLQPRMLAFLLDLYWHACRSRMSMLFKH